jgi:GNAT superfamily N-acetyltransferase
VTDLRIEPVKDETGLRDWRHVHNLIVPPAAMSLDEVRERSGRNRLENAYLGDVLVGCSTVRPPEDGVVTVIARVLPEFRRRGYGDALYENDLTRARALGAGAIETVVLAANSDGVRFAEARGFVETERYVLDGETDLWITLRLA